MNRTVYCLAEAVLLLTFVSLAFADIPIPTKAKIYFSKDGQPYHEAVDFTIRCYGWRVFPPGGKPNNSEAREVYSLAGRCPSYGCEIVENLHLNYLRIERCDFEGVTGGKSFLIRDYGKEPLTNCSEITPAERFERSCEMKLEVPE